MLVQATRSFVVALIKQNVVCTRSTIKSYLEGGLVSTRKILLASTIKHCRWHSIASPSPRTTSTSSSPPPPPPPPPRCSLPRQPPHTKWPLLAILTPSASSLCITTRNWPALISTGKKKKKRHKEEDQETFLTDDDGSEHRLLLSPR